MRPSCNAIRPQSRSRGFIVLSSFSSSSDHVVDLKWLFLFFLLDNSLRISKYYLFFLFLLLHISAIKLRKGDHFLFIHKIRYSPLSFLFVPVRIIDNNIELILTHEYIYDCLKFLHFFLLESDSIEKFFLLIFMLVLNVSEFC